MRSNARSGPLSVVSRRDAVFTTVGDEPSARIYDVDED